jgi:hypothetical protein
VKNGIIYLQILSIMKKFNFICVLFLILNITLSGQDQKKNIIGVSAGIVPGIMDMYFDVPYNFWPNREISPIYQLFYARQVLGSFRIGGFLEFEEVRFTDDISTEVHSFKRYNFGVNWLGQFPKTALHMQLGGYAGYGFLSAVNWDKLSGYDLGLIAGPAFEKNRFGIALHLQSGHAWYDSTGTPQGVMLYTPKILLKVYYKI